jgi:hypothetical protein
MSGELRVAIGAVGTYLYMSSVGFSWLHNSPTNPHILLGWNLLDLVWIRNPVNCDYKYGPENGVLVLGFSMTSGAEPEGSAPNKNVAYIIVGRYVEAVNLKSTLGHAIFHFYYRLPYPWPERA